MCVFMRFAKFTCQSFGFSGSGLVQPKHEKCCTSMKFDCEGSLCNCTSNNEDPDKMLHNVTFHQGLHCLLRQKRSSGTEINLYLVILTCDPLICIMSHHKLIVLNQMG